MLEELHRQMLPEELEMVKKKKTMTDMMLQIRNTWKINPRTRIKEDEQKNKKKRREIDKKLVKPDDSTPE
jgi:prophage tail gpP-like protein